MLNICSKHRIRVIPRHCQFEEPSTGNQNFLTLVFNHFYQNGFTRVKTLNVQLIVFLVPHKAMILSVSKNFVPCPTILQKNNQEAEYINVKLCYRDEYFKTFFALTKQLMS